MTRILSLLLVLAAATAGLLAANDSGAVGFLESLGGVALIIGFAIVAAGLVVNRDA